MWATAVVHCSPAEVTDVEDTYHLTYSGAIEVGNGTEGCTKSVAGTGVSTVDGTGDMTCALSIEVFENETFAVESSAKYPVWWLGKPFASYFECHLLIEHCCCMNAVALAAYIELSEGPRATEVALENLMVESWVVTSNSDMFWFAAAKCCHGEILLEMSVAKVVVDSGASPSDGSVDGTRTDVLGPVEEETCNTESTTS